MKVELSKFELSLLCAALHSFENLERKYAHTINQKGAQFIFGKPYTEQQIRDAIYNIDYVRSLWLKLNEILDP